MGDKPPSVYFRQFADRCAGGERKYGGITDWPDLDENLRAHCIPEGGFDGLADDDDRFLEERTSSWRPESRRISPSGECCPNPRGGAELGSSTVFAQPEVEDAVSNMSPQFDVYIGIDYSGAQTPLSSLKGLRVYRADRASMPEEVQPPPSPRKYWTRRGIAQWLLEELREDHPILIGIDHGFSFPLRYFEAHHLPPDWSLFLDDFQRHWPTDGDHVYVDFIRDGFLGNGAARSGDRRWRRITEERARSAKSVFHFDVHGSVAKSTHAGLNWLRHIRREAGDRVHFWPFDGWNIPEGCSAIAEVYPSLWRPMFPRGNRSPDQHDAYTAAAWMRLADLDGSLQGYLDPPLDTIERRIAGIEGWILGIK